MTTWRDVARPIIAEVMARVGSDDPGRLKRELFDAYPFGQREYHPYKIWLDEIRVQKGLKTLGRKPKPPDPNQGRLFRGEG